MDAARLAGIKAARKAQIVSELAATISASGSQKETPYNCAEIRPSGGNCQRQAQCKPHQHALKGSAEHKLNHLRVVGAKRHANPDFTSSLRNRVGRHTVEANGSQEQRYHAKQPARLATARS
jgi:hypothetical protein